MSKFVDQIIEELKTQPQSFKDYKGRGVQKNNLVVRGFGNSAHLSIIHVELSGVDMPLTYFDKFRLERAISNWYETIPLDVLETNQISEEQISIEEFNALKHQREDLLHQLLKIMDWARIWGKTNNSVFQEAQEAINKVTK